MTDTHLEPALEPDAAPQAGQDAADRAYYARELAAGVERFLEPRRETCPWCGSRDLSVRVRTRDLIQRKPGVFTLERCGTCAHVFQNPRVSAAGLSFYYRDFYDGRGRATVEAMGEHQVPANHDRTRMVAQFFGPAGPGAWLDVGTGMGHFARHAATVLPGTSFDGLDQGAGVLEAQERGWLRRGYRASFPELAAELAGRYDVISMFHYLEHTLDPRAELAAAAEVLEPGGYLLIEVPDATSRLANVFRSWWIPWFQPQHLHFVPLPNLCQALAEQGFTPVAVHRGSAHQACDSTFAVIFALIALAPDPDSPWRPAGAPAWRAKATQLAWTKVFPRLGKAAAKLDEAIGALARRTGDANAYRVLARKETPR